MKRLIVTVVGTVALMAGTSYAGSGCIYGDHTYSNNEEQSAVLAAVDETSPELLAKLKKLEQAEALEKLIETPVIHN